MLHRILYPEGIRCRDQDVVRWDSEYGQIETQANTFAANLLMPLDDFRRLVPAGKAVDVETLSMCADRYKVSFIAATLRWLSYTDRRAILVASRDNYMLWARSSESAYKSGAYFRTSREPVSIPTNSLAATKSGGETARQGMEFLEGVWLNEPVYEMTIQSEQYYFALSLLLLGRNHISCRQ